jgi:Tol biopolymer transport system component
MTYTRVTTASDVATRDSYDPSLSADGRHVAFRSDSDFLGQNILDDQYEIWFFDLETKALTRVTTASDGATRDSSDANLNADGSVLAFHSDSDFFGQNILDNQNEVWLYDVVGMTYTRVTTASSSTKDSMDPFLSADGSIVAFESTSDLLGLGNVTAQEIWLYDTTTMTYTRVTTATPGNRDCYNPSLNAAGTVVAFATDADYFGQNIPQYQFEVWLYDTAAMTLTRATYASDSNRASDRTTLSADGSLVAFQSDSDFLGDDIPDGQFEVWLYNAVTMTYTRVTVGSDQDRDSFRPSLSADGSVLAFHSDSDLLGEGIPNSRDEIWLARLGHRVYLPLVLK